MPTYPSNHFPRHNQRVFIAFILTAGLLLGSLIVINPRVSADTGTGSVSLTAIGSAATENFDTLSNTAGSTTNTALPTGWYITEGGGGARDNEQYAVDTGGSTTGDTYSYGSAAATDRALGELRSGTLIPLFGAKFTNNTGVTVTSLDVSYTGEQWRFGGVHSTVADRLDFQYSVNATDLSTGTYLDANALDFNPPVTTGTAGALDGNAAANRTAISSTITGLSIPNGATFFIRFNDVDATGADDGLAVDNFSITPQTAPVTPTLNIGDVSQAEGDAGTSTFTFNVSLTSAAGPAGVTFTVDTADGTATAPSDYTAIVGGSGSIAQGNTSTTVSVTVNGDTTPEPNETFFVNISNVTGANNGDLQGQGTINNDDVTLTPIHDIQGNGSTSPLAGSAVSTRGIVTGIKQGSSGGFYIQEPDATVDADPNTSEGIFVFTGATPPAGAVIGNYVQVSGTIQEFVPSADPFQKPLTEFTSGSTTNVVSTGNPLPTAATISAAETQVNNLDNLERYEGMRVSVPSLTVVGPTQGTITEPSATVFSTGVFFGVVTGVPRPFREAGINISDPLPPGAPATVPRFDENPERIRVDSDAQPGTTALDVTAGTLITNLIGELDYSFRGYTVLPEAANPPVVGSQPGSTPVPDETANEFTVASFNMERFFDTADDPSTSDPILTSAAFNRRLAKASLIVRTVQRYPDVIGVEEMENLTTLQAVATQINNDAVTLDSLPNPNYTAYLVEGNDVGGIDVGFLVKESRIAVVDVTQLHASTTYTNPNTGAQDILNDRPPLMLRATCPRPAGGSLAFTVIVNHLRSLNNIDDTTVDGTGTVGARVRAKRRAQAEDLAGIIQARQVADPNELIITVGDMNAFRVNDGYVDMIGTILGTPAPASDVTLASPDLVNPDLTDLVDTLPASQQYSYNFDGNAQTLDHIILNHKAFVFLTRFAYARDDSDFAVKNYELTNEKRISDHDQPVAYFNLALAPTASRGTIAGRLTDANGAPVAGSVVQLSGNQSRKTITDAYGYYSFNDVETSAFYTVTPSRTNYTFSPASRSFSQIGNQSEASFTASTSGQIANPLDVSEFFVRQQYVDMLSREPDEAGFNYWSDQINQCGTDNGCISARRRDVAAAFFIEREMQDTGSFVYGLYEGTLGRQPAYGEYTADRQQVIGGANLEAKKQAFADSFVQRTEFVNRYQSYGTATSFVDALLRNVNESTGVDLTSQRETLIARYNSGANLQQGRSLVIRAATEDGSFKQAEYNPAFVLTEYFSYLRRDPDQAGFGFWVNVLTNGDPGNYRGMVCGFINSAEYQGRFSSVISHNDGECSR